MRPNAGFIAVLALVVCACASGCGKDIDRASSRVQSARQRVITQNDLSQLAILYNQYFLLDPVPASMDELKANIKKDAPNIYAAIEKGDIELVYRRKVAGDAVVAYQKQADLDGAHLVAFGDGSVRKLKEDELKAAMKKGE